MNKLQEQAFFFKRLAFLLQADVSLVESLHVLHEQGRSRQHTRALAHVARDVEAGRPLSAALQQFPALFGALAISILTVGESSGTLSQSAAYLAQELHKKEILKRKIMGAFLYPAVVLLATLGIAAFLMLYLFPKIIPVFASLHVALPLTTRIVIAASLFLEHWGLVAFILLVLVIATCAAALRRSAALHLRYDSALMRVPVVGSLLRSYNVANATRTLGLLLDSGATLAAALSITADTTQNLLYKRRFGSMRDAVNRGERLSSYMERDTACFPELLPRMVAVGERTGSLPQTFTYVSQLCDNEVDEFTKNLSTLIEPVLMIAMGLVVGFIAISIITPLYGITQNIHA